VGGTEVLCQRRWNMRQIIIGRVLGLTALLTLSLTACNQNKYRVIERADRYLDKQNRPVSDPLSESSDHDEVVFVLTHGGHKIHATCDLSTLDKLDPNASCGLRPLRTYECVVGRDDVLKAPMPQSDLLCKDGDGRKVYLYVSKEE
jgi:hypothetical protein